MIRIFYVVSVLAVIRSCNTGVVNTEKVKEKEVQPTYYVMI